MRPLFRNIRRQLANENKFIKCSRYAIGEIVLVVIGIWELDIALKNGTVKFRSRDSWNKNWGGNTFPNGNTVFRGYDIPVKAGNYHVILNLFENTYTFIKKEDQ